MIEVISIFLLVFLVYAKTFGFGLIVDDIRQKKDIESPNSIFKDISFIENIRRRFYGVGTLAVNCKVNVKAEHVFTCFLHAVTCALIYLALGKNEVSYWAGVLYAVNASNNQTSIWLNGRRYQINIILTLLMIFIGGWGIFLYPLTLGLQFNALFAPVLIGLWWAMPVVLIVLGQKIITRFRERSAKVSYSARKAYSPKRLIVIVKSYGFYFWKMLMPGTVLFYYDTLHYWGMTKEGDQDAYSLNKDFAKGVTAILISLVGIFFFQGDLKLFWLFMCLSIVQWSNIVTITQNLADRYMSLSNVFMMFFLSWAVFQVFETPEAVLLAIATAYTVMLYRCFPMYRDIQSFYDYHIYHDPAGVSARSFKISDFMLNNNWINALACATEGLYFRPNDFKLNYQAALSLKVLGNKKQALEYLDIAEQNPYAGDTRMQEIVTKLREQLK